MPISAVIVPGRASDARCIARPRVTTSSSAGRSSSARGGDERDELPERVSRRPGETHAVGLQHAERSQVAGEECWLDDLGRLERLLVATQRGQIALHSVGHLLDHPPAFGMLEPAVRHAGELPNPCPGNTSATFISPTPFSSLRGPPVVRMRSPCTVV